MRVLISGATGLVGSALRERLAGQGHQVLRLMRSQVEDAQAVHWDPLRGQIDRHALEGMDAVVHLAGENIAAGRWTAGQKARIRDSRVEGTRFLCETLSQLKRPPRILASASAIGCYGDRGDEILREDSPLGRGFLVEVSQAWEGATEAAQAVGIRVAHLRFGVILSTRGGALAKMLLPFKLGLGGRLGDGKQYMSCIALSDAVGAIEHILAEGRLEGAVNVVGPEPVRNCEFTKTLGRVLRRPTFLPVPAFALRLALGEMADALLLSSAKVEPARLVETGFQFRFISLEEALRSELEAA